MGLWLTDAQGVLLRGNPEAIRIWGGNPLATAENHHMFKARRLPGGEKLLPGDWAINRVLKDGEPVFDELLEIEAFDGVRRTVLHSTVPLRDQADEIIGAIVSHLDITQRRNIEEALIASEQRLRRVFDTSPSVLLIKDGNGRYQMVNQKTAELFCRKPDDIIGKTDQEMAVVGFATALTPRSEYQDPDELHDHGHIPGREEHLVVNGKHTWFRVHRNPIAFGDLEGCTLVNAVDITAARELRENLRDSEVMTRSILDSLASRVVLMDTELRITWANKAACVQSGRTRAQLTGEYCYHVFMHNQTTPCKECPTLKCLVSGQPSEQLRKSVHGRTWLIHAVPIRNAQQEIMSVIEVADDITERLVMEKQLQQAQKMQSLGTLAGGIAHDFKTSFPASLVSASWR